MATLTTPKYAIPYPDGNERVMDGDNAMGAIATRLDNLLPVTKTGSVTTDASGFATVTHSIGTTPTHALFALNGTTGSLYGHWFVDTYTTTTVRVRVCDPSGVPANAQTVAYRATYFFT